MTINLPDPSQILQQLFGGVVSGPNNIAGFDLKTLVGLTGVPFVEAVVQYLHDQWNMPSKLAPLAAIIFAILLNVLLALALKNDVLSAIYIGFFTGLFSSVWHEKTKS